MKLTQKQKKFADYYLKTGNAEKSAKRAGYSARGNTTKLLQNTTICDYIRKVNEKIDKTKIADMQEVREFWSETMRQKEIEYKDRLKASEYIAKTNGAFLDKVEHKGDLGLNVKIDYGDEDA